MYRSFFSVYKNEPFLLIGILILMSTSIIMLGSLAPELFPQYFLYIILALLSFVLFSQIDFEILKIFHWHLYIGSLILLILPLIIGQVTRGVIRWIPIGSFAFQPTEIVRPFLFIFFAVYLTQMKLTTTNLIKAGILAGIPIVLIVVQPSLGVAILTTLGVGGIFLSLNFDKRKVAFFALLGILVSPMMWLFLQDYQKARLIGLFSASADPTGAGYNSIQSIIAVGSGMLRGRGLGEGVQTQLSFLPERHTDFIFASIAEEFGFLGTTIIIAVVFYILYRIVKILENSRDYSARAFTSGVLLSIFTQIVVHMGMNMGIAPITGLPLPLVSAGGSSLIASMITFGMLLQAKDSTNAV